MVLGAMAYRAGADAGARIRTLHAAVDAGVNAIDTAPLYEFGESETVVGRALAGRRDGVVVMTKVGLAWGPDARGEVLFETPQRCVRKDSRPAAVRRDVEGSLQRLAIDHVDVCFVHHPDAHTPIADTIGELLRLRAEGKIRAIGLSNFTPAQVDEAVAALGDVPLAGHQSELNLLRRHPPGGLLPALANADAPLLAYSPLAHGALAGRGLARRVGDDDHRRWDPIFDPRNAARLRVAHRDALQRVATQCGVSTAQVAIAWVLAQPHVGAVIVGASRPEQAQASARAVSLRLSPGDQEGLRAHYERVVVRRDLPERRRDRAYRVGRRVAGALARRVAAVVQRGR